MTRVVLDYSLQLTSKEYVDYQDENSVEDKFVVSVGPLVEIRALAVFCEILGNVTLVALAMAE